MITKFVARTTLGGSRIDRATGIITGVSLIALGDARGHGKAVDQKTLESVRDCAKQYGDGLRVKFNPETFSHGVGGLAGFIPPNTIHVSDGKALGDLHIYEHFNAKAKEYLYEIAERTPGNIGLSIEFSGEDEEIEENKFARCDEIFAATIVDLPAANPTGLFAADLTKENQSQQSAATNDTTMDEKTLTALSAAIVAGVTKAFEPLIQKFSAPEKTQADLDKEEASAAGVADGDDDEAKKKKVASYRASKQNVSAMSRGDLEKVVAETSTKTFMQCFRSTGGKPVKVNPEPEHGEKDFEALVAADMAGGGVSRGASIVRMRKQHGEAYNTFMAKKHPNTQQMAA